jgi:predicted cobalt transporter CbtA
MLVEYLKYGLKAGVIAGIALGLFMVFVGNPLVGAAELFEEGHDADDGHGAEASGGDGGVAISVAVTNTVSIAGAVAMAVLLGAVFGVAYYVLEPAIPGAGDTQSYLLAAAGFVTVSGAPWLVLQPQPPGVEGALATDARMTIYAGMMVAGLVTCGLALGAPLVGVRGLLGAHGMALLVVLSLLSAVVVVV